MGFAVYVRSNITPLSRHTSLVSLFPCFLVSLFPCFLVSLSTCFPVYVFPLSAYF